METEDNKSKHNTHLTQTRETDIDIIKGACNTDQIKGMQENAAKAKKNLDAPKPTKMPAVDDGGNFNSNDDGGADENLKNPATGGI
ncbi:MAG: hypothetical protein EOO13_04680 [Chitinophagaceae bacterium]|nr:MAG: hypothetical protein EOO13_04680 [Chitinophagaceae bacterium]